MVKVAKKIQGIPNKIKISDEAYSRLKSLKARTKLEAWVIARLGVCLSLSDPHVPTLSKDAHVPTPPDDEKGEKAMEKEFNRYTLTGEYDLLYSELLRTYLDRYCVGLDISEADLFKAHLNRGIITLSRQTKSLADIADLLSTRASV